ncbi:MAG: hypothetical protein RLY14_2095 [Planctomycetota bacterium]|jgi:hypothetical protein
MTEKYCVSFFACRIVMPLQPFFVLSLLAAFLLSCPSLVLAELIRAGVGKVEITNKEVVPVSAPLFVKALVLQTSEFKAAVITLDVVALERIGPLPKGFMKTVRDQLQARFGIKPNHVLFNTSHCHGSSCADVTERTVVAVEQAISNLEDVRVGYGEGLETRISQNRRMKLKDGKVADVRHAYSVPPDEEVAEAGPIDPEISILRFDRLDGSSKALLYVFACHPIQGVPGSRNTADLVGYCSQVIEETLSPGTVAFFMQGCGGDINPIRYKDITHPRDAELLGNLLAVSVLKANRDIKAVNGKSLSWHQEVMSLPRADLAPTIADLEAEQVQLVNKLQGTSLNFKNFQKLYSFQNAFSEFPSADAAEYMHEELIQRPYLKELDAENRRNVDAYLKNIHTMEALTRNQTNLALLKMHHKENLDAASRTIEVEVVRVKIGDFKMLTFPGELTVQIGLNIKQYFKDEPVAVCGYSNGYIYYAPTTEQLANRGYAQEDSDCLLAPQWQAIFEDKAIELLKK